MQTKTNDKRQTTANKWMPPRGIRIIELPNRPLGWAVQWRVDGSRKTKSLATRALAVEWARQLAGDARENGLAALRLDRDEAIRWRAFLARVGADVDLDAVAAIWLAAKPTQSAGIGLLGAVETYLADRKAQGLQQTTLWHYGSELRTAGAALPGDLASITAKQIESWLASAPVGAVTRRGYIKRLATFFGWAVRKGYVAKNPCDSVPLPALVETEVQLLTVEQGAQLFDKNLKAKHARELLGRLALEAFAGLRFSSASKLAGDDVKFAERGIVLPAAKIKTQRRQWIDGLPDNLWRWLEWSQPQTWSMTPRQYLEAKSDARKLAELPEIRNALRHSFCSYHIALHKDASRTSVILCHTSPAMLWRHYRGNATTADGAAWFAIVPPATT